MFKEKKIKKTCQEVSLRVILKARVLARHAKFAYSWKDAEKELTDKGYNIENYLGEVDYVCNWDVNKLEGNFKFLLKEKLCKKKKNESKKTQKKNIILSDKNMD